MLNDTYIFLWETMAIIIISSYTVVARNWGKSLCSRCRQAPRCCPCGRSIWTVSRYLSTITGHLYVNPRRSRRYIICVVKGRETHWQRATRSNSESPSWKYLRTVDRRTSAASWVAGPNSWRTVSTANRSSKTRLLSMRFACPTCFPSTWTHCYLSVPLPLPLPLQASSLELYARKSDIFGTNRRCQIFFVRYQIFRRYQRINPGTSVKHSFALYFLSLTVVDARHVLNPAKVPLHPNAYAVILIRQLQADRRIVIEGFYLAGNPSVVLEAALLGSVDRAALYLRDADFPRSRKRSAARDECQGNRISQPDTRVHVHCEYYLFGDT